MLFKIFGPWFFNLLISVLFTSFHVALFLKTDFASIIFYDLSIIFLIHVSIAFMATFLWQMRNNLVHLTQPIVIPHPTFICSLVLTISVTLGYCYIFIYKLALYGCDRAVEARDGFHMVIDSVLRLTIALFSFVSFVYIMQRAQVGTIKTRFDFLTRNVINCVFGIVWLRFILLKALFTIEQFCRDQTEMHSVVKDFCPTYIKNGFHCSQSDLRDEQLTWYRLHYGLLKFIVVTCASELIPVLLVGHWPSKQSRSYLGYKKLSVTDAIGSPDHDHQSMLIHSRKVRFAIKWCAILLSIGGFLLWLLCFYNFINDRDESLLVFVQDGTELVVSGIQLTYFIMLFLWARRIPLDSLDLHRRAESRADRVLIFGATILLSMEWICEIFELLFLSTKKRARTVIKVLDILDSTFSMMAKWLEGLCLIKVIALRERQLRSLRNILPFIAIEFAMTFFYIETEKHHLKEVIESLDSSEVFVLIGVIGRILDTANYIYTFTCALCWIEVLLRFKFNYFVIGKKFVVEENDDDEGLQMDKFQN